MKLRATLAGPLFFPAALSACGGGNLASQIAVAPEYNPKNETKCGVRKSQERPLIVEWPSSDRLALETRTRQGVVVVRYAGCEMEVLPRCRVPVNYSYQGGNRKVDKVVINDADDLYANLPVGAANFEGDLKRAGKLTVEMNLVGRYEAAASTVNADDLQGECAGATHFVYGVTVGAFDFFAGGEAIVGAKASVAGYGGGAHSEASRQTLTTDGDVNACDKATPDDKGPPPQCGALIRVEVVPLGQPKKFEPTCPNGTIWTGQQCVGKTATPAGTPPWLFYTVAGGAIAALGVASGVAVNANSLNNQQTAENPYVRDPNVKNSIQSQSTLANVLFGTGGALGLGAVVLVFTTKWKAEATPEPTVSLTPWFSPQGAGVGAGASF